MIKLINSVADTINRDPDVADRLRIVFFPDYNVKNGQLIYPAADLSEQISLAGMEASGTGNMKLAMNGALTIGTLDGANVEIRDEVGAENFFLFGLTAAEVQAVKSSGYSPDRYYQTDAQLREAIDLISSGFFTHGDRQCLRPLVDNLLYHDPFLVMADFAAYDQCQQRVDQIYQQPDHWTRMSILNTARMGKFSSDRSIKEYCQNIWKVSPQPIQLG
jgi:starch phosphorylase